MECVFWRLQQAFTTALTLVHFDLDKPIWLDTDLSSFAIAGILSLLVEQAYPKAPKKAPTPGKKVALDWHPVAFWLQTMVTC
jgi:alpha-D-ribose 1-methylphosphonate 5-triphosphate synthase subunit PhnH